MSSLDFTDFEGADLIPAGTDAILQIRIKFGEATDNVLTFTKNRDAEILKAEFTIVDGPHARRKFWQDFMVKGATDGQKMMADRNNAILKTILDSAKNLDPTDKSPAARQARTAQYRDFDGMRFQAVIAVEPARTDKNTGQTYQARNALEKVITRGLQGWRGPIDQVAAFNDDLPFGHTSAPNGAAAAAPGPATGTPMTNTPMTKPDWAK
jgi:hypothetical protein